LAVQPAFATFVSKYIGMKFLLTLALLYLAYRFFVARPAIAAAAKRYQDTLRSDPPPTATRKKRDDEYIDYEEVD
jgi:hypothetical protein